MNNKSTDEIIGRCYGETGTDTVSFVSTEMPQVGEYVYLEYDGKIIMGTIDKLHSGSLTLREDIIKPDTIEKILNIEGDIDNYVRGSISIIGDKDNLIKPRRPAPPGTIVKRANIELLQEVFKMDDGLKLGTILNQPEVDVKVDINKLVNRHVAILAMTGSGKSNTTSVIMDGLLKVHAPILVFDMHGEYIDAEFENGKTAKIQAKINPNDLTLSEYKKLAQVGDNAVNQEKYLRDAHKYAEDEVKEGRADHQSFIELMRSNLSQTLNEKENEDKKNSSHIDAINQVYFKLDDMEKKYNTLLDSNDVGDIIDQIEPSRINIIPLHNLDERAMDILVNHVLYNILQRRKNGQIEYPIFIVIEEAHILAANNRNTRSKETISRIAREGRKFGVGLCLVSQSPKNLDSATLSQVNNLIIMRLVEPKDQKHVQESSEGIDNNILDKLPSLNVGEAVIIGQMTKVPVSVKIDAFKGKLMGRDPNVLEIWGNFNKQKEEKREQSIKEINDLGV
ncbi:MAG: ATP-binding protein [Methanosphaera sp.]|nr:ATP-binding protein [Methanosphaera sp.]